MKEFIPGLYLLKLPLDKFFPGHINSYLLRDKTGYVLIDTGWDTKSAFSSLKTQLAEIGVSIEQISKILLTHSHTDHAGMVGRIKKLAGATIYMHKLEEEVVKSRFLNSVEHGHNDFFTVTDSLLKKHGTPAADLSRPDFVPPKVSSPPKADVILTDGEILEFDNFKLKVIFTSGHSPGHLCFYETKHQLLFSGDLILPETISNVGLHLHQSANPLDAYLNSLKLVGGLSVSQVLPAHEYIFTDLTGRIGRIAGHHAKKNTGVMQVVADGKPRTAFEISYAMSIFPDTRLSGWDKLSLWDKRFILLEIIAHLESLFYRGKLMKYSDNGAILYQFRV
ncbi:MBL fold metallo-hydrolase [Chloroflexota bacterium]